MLAKLKPGTDALTRRSAEFGIALIYAGLNEKDAAFEWLEKARENHEGYMALIRVEPMLENVRDDSRFADLLRRMNLN